MHKHPVTDDISFKLLGSVPLAATAGSGILTILEKSALFENRPYAALAITALSALGALITFGLFRWELRNIQKCKWLIARAAAIEARLYRDRSLELQFQGMASKSDLDVTAMSNIHLSSVFVLPWGKTQAEKVIYSAATAIWLVPLGISLHRLFSA